MGSLVNVDTQPRADISDNISTMKLLLLISLCLSCCCCAPSSDAVRLPSTARLDQRIPNSCSTLAGDSCVFPFSYKGVEYYKCTYADSPIPWCATQVSSSGEVVTNKWGDCSSSATSSCPSETIATPSCTTTQGQCVFPFRYKGVVYTSCTTVDRASAWCSTQTDIAGLHQAGSEGDCPASCPVESGTSSSCPPGTSYTQDCNTCVCDSSGVAVCSTNTCTTTNTAAINTITKSAKLNTVPASVNFNTHH